jgi:hypothetical protein
MGCLLFFLEQNQHIAHALHQSINMDSFFSLRCTHRFLNPCLLQRQMTEKFGGVQETVGMDRDVPCQNQRCVFKSFGLKGSNVLFVGKRTGC